MNGYMMGVYVTLGTGTAGGSNGGSSGNGQPNPGNAFGYYIQDPSGQWYWVSFNGSGEVEWTPTPPPKDPCNPNGGGGGPVQPTQTPCPLQSTYP